MTDTNVNIGGGWMGSNIHKIFNPANWPAPQPAGSLILHSEIGREVKFDLAAGFSGQQGP